MFTSSHFPRKVPLLFAQLMGGNISIDTELNLEPERKGLRIADLLAPFFTLPFPRRYQRGLGPALIRGRKRSEQAQSLSSFHRSHCTARGPGGLGWRGDRGQQQPELPEPSSRHWAAYRTEMDFLTVLEAGSRSRCLLATRRWEGVFMGSGTLTLGQLSAPCSSGLQALGRTKLRPS